jgi:uncharacterized membrane-anchored protein
MSSDGLGGRGGSAVLTPPPRTESSGFGQLVRRRWVEPHAPKVPEIIAIFWVVKILTTAGGEATSDWLARFGNFVGGGAELLVFAVGLVLQFGTRRYRAIAYWWLAFSIAIFGTGVADFLHLDVHLSYTETTVLWAAILALVFWLWHRQEGTLSIHSVHSRRREFYYWCTVFATFALGTALGDLTAATWKLGFLGSAVLFSLLIVLPWIAHRTLRLNAVVAFWASYVLTRPVGASWVDWVDKPKSLSGLNAGNGLTALACFLAVLALVVYLEIARPDVQQGVDQYEV